MKKTAEKHYKRWLFQAPIGLILIGAGISLVCDAAIQKFHGVDWWLWVGYGTIALVVLNSGISLVVDAGMHRLRYEQADQENG